jgi:radical SAM superfamily enzyme YgiQ (UPF0313 family)
MQKYEDKPLVFLVDPVERKKSSKKVEFILPHQRDYAGSPVSIKEPLGIQYIASYLDLHGYKTSVLYKSLIDDNELLSKINESRSNLIAVCISQHSSYLVSSSLSIAKKVKDQFPDIPIIVGGYHPTGDPDIVMADDIDFAVIGEGEETVRELVDSIRMKSNNFSEVEGISYKDNNNKVQITKRRKRLDYSKLPWPKRDEMMLSLCQPGPLSYPSTGRVAQIALSRGCPNTCDFCASPQMWGGVLKYRDPIDVVKELKYLINTHGVSNFFICDLSFNATKNKVITLLEELKKAKKELSTDFGLHVMCTVHVTDEILHKMREANIRKIDLGIEDVLPDTLEKIKSSQNLETIRNALYLANKNGILIRGLLMVGYPWETLKTMQRRREIILELPIDQLRLAYYLPFVGTPLHKQLKSKIYKSYDSFTTDTPVVKCDGISEKDLVREVNKTITAYYNSDNYLKHVYDKMTAFPDLCDSFQAFFDYLNSQNILSPEVYTKMKG